MPKIIPSCEMLSPWVKIAYWFNRHPKCKKVALFLWFLLSNLGKGLHWILHFTARKNRHFRALLEYLIKKYHQHHEILDFIHLWIRNPLAMGAVAPSSKYLAFEMASHCSNDYGLTIELGAGTGVVSEALLQLGIKAEQLILLEFSSFLANQLRRKFPEVQTIQGDAVQLTMLLKAEQRPIHTFVSSLPLRALPPAMTSAILEQIVKLLSPRGKYIQFTYSLRKTHFRDLRPCRLVAAKRIWRNFPPARVEVWEKR
jgi:phosphatidylethanolamine/phosphatidyl-N-methylethanolamine N-methyltransferase